MRRSILVFGFCQASHIGRILNAIPWVTSRFNVCAVEICADPITGEFRTPPREILDTCECAYYQLGLVDKRPGYLDRLAEQGKTLRFPMLTCQLLWPAHMELNRRISEPGLPWGRFPYCDRVLLDLLETGQTDEQIVEQYLQMDMGQVFEMDRLAELWHYRIEELDQSCDVPMAELQWREWRLKQHYWAVSHPTNVLVGVVLRELLRRTIGPAPEEEVVEALRTNELNEFMTPIHPSVARILGLEWYSPEYRYGWPDGPFTMREWALEHVRYTRRVLAEGGA